VQFDELPGYSRRVDEILDPDAQIELGIVLLNQPTSGDLIPGSKSLRKIRVAAGGRGKRGGARVIYYWFVSPELITLCRIYRKNEQENLSKGEIQQIAKELGL
jgi:mRNA-degrading endonuclease RelE of RelBE toxin-antitoxin system